jgi:ACS family sodium-dependent inorganic phosphate cotransporter
VPRVQGLVGCRGYLLTQIAGGVWADKFGGKPILGFGVVWWSVATACTPLAAQMGLVPLLIVRTCMGIGEGVALSPTRVIRLIICA